jgi:hypothetical protein
MRLTYIVALLIFGTAAANADMIETVTFSGTIESPLGVISAGDAFSGTMSWDISTLGLSSPGGGNGWEATALSFTMPLTDGLSVAGLPDSQLQFAAAAYASGGSFETLQINDLSTVDGNVYTFFIGPFGGAVVLNGDYTAPDNFTNFSFSGPTESTTPEPATSASFAIGLGLIATLALRRLHTPGLG